MECKNSYFPEFIDYTFALFTFNLSCTSLLTVEYIGEHILYTHIHICMYSYYSISHFLLFTDPNLGLSNLIVSKYPYYEDSMKFKKM